MISFTLMVDPRHKARDLLVSWRKKLQDLRWAWPEVSAHVEKHHKRIFDSEGALNESGTGTWRPLHEMTVMARLRGMQVSKTPPFDYISESDEGPSGRILHWTWRLRWAMTDASRAAGNDAVREYRRNSMEWGTRTPYAYIHQEGGVSEQGYRVPRRPFLDTTMGPEIAVKTLERILANVMGGSLIRAA